MYDICLLTIALEKGMSAVSLANLMPSYWADFIRNAEVKDVKPIGTTPLMNKP